MNTRRTLAINPWTAAQEEQLRRFARANTPPREIAQRLGRPLDAVVERAHELGLTMKRS